MLKQEKKGTHVKELDEIKEIEEQERNRLFEIVRKMTLASIGAVGLAQDELEDFVNRLVERGEIAEKDARKLMREVSEKRGKHTEHQVEKQFEKMLERMNVPTKSDITELGAKITTLTHKVDELRKEKPEA